MADIPITLRFFEKLNLFQELKRIDREKRPEWEVEKHILSWAANPGQHRHLYSPLTVAMAREHAEITGEIPSDILDREEWIHICFGNLVMRGFATWTDDHAREIRFTRDGFSVGETINEIRMRRWKKPFYYFLYYLSWAIFAAGTIIVFAEAWKAVLSLFIKSK